MDGKTPALAEAARRLLRTEGCVLTVPAALLGEARSLALAISDGIPKMIREPCIVEGATVEVAGLLRIAGEAPPLEVAWVPGTLPELWPRWTKQIHDLIAAGYPGCVGCGGPGAEGPWDETASRARASVNGGVT